MLRLHNQVAYAFCIPVYIEESISKNDKRITMAHQEHGLCNTIPINRTYNQLIRVNFGAPLLVEPVITARGRQELDKS